MSDGGENLVRAIRDGDKSTVLRLLQAGVDANTRDGKSHDQAPALYVAVCLKLQNVVFLLLHHGADVNLSTSWGNTPLHAAADHGHDEILTMLLKHVAFSGRRAANINKQNLNGDTALHLAAVRGHVRICRTLITHKIDVFILNNRNRTATQEASANGKSTVFAELNHYEATRPEGGGSAKADGTSNGTSRQADTQPLFPVSDKKPDPATTISGILPGSTPRSHNTGPVFGSHVAQADFCRASSAVPIRLHYTYMKRSEPSEGDDASQGSECSEQSSSDSVTSSSTSPEPSSSDLASHSSRRTVGSRSDMSTSTDSVDSCRPSSQSSISSNISYCPVTPASQSKKRLITVQGSTSPTLRKSVAVAPLSQSKSTNSMTNHHLPCSKQASRQQPNTTVADGPSDQGHNGYISQNWESPTSLVSYLENLEMILIQKDDELERFKQRCMELEEENNRLKQYLACKDEQLFQINSILEKRTAYPDM